MCEVYEAIWKRLQPLYLQSPTIEQWKEIASEFLERWQFPNCLGALDRKHVLIQAPPNSGSNYFNYKKTFSIVLLALVDHKYCFSVIDIGSYGSNSDVGIFRNSALRRKLQNQTLHIPEDRPLVNTDNEALCPHVIVGDEAFPLMPNLMRPFPGNDLDYAKRIFNYRLSRARRIAENGFGKIANRWRIFHRKIPLAPENVDCVIKATVVLHNTLCLENGVEARNQDSESGLIHEDLHDGILRPLRREGHRPQASALQVRKVFKSYFVSPRGAVKWQDNACFGQAN